MSAIKGTPNYSFDSYINCTYINFQLKEIDYLDIQFRFCNKSTQYNYLPRFLLL